MFGDCSGHRPRPIQNSFRWSSGRRIGRSARIRPMLIGRASCSPTRSAWRRICTGSARTFVPSFAWSSDAVGMFGRLTGSRSSRTLLTLFLASLLSRPRKSTSFVLSAHLGRRPRCSMPSSIRQDAARLSRHHYDLARLYRHEYGQLAIKIRSPGSSCGAQEDFLSRSGGAVRFGQARKPSGMPSGIPRCADSERLPGHAGDVFSEAPPFDTVMADLRELEDRVNR